MSEHTTFNPARVYDVVIVGAGPVGALMAEELTRNGKHVLIIEAGRASGETYDGYQSYVDTYQAALVKSPNAPYPQNPNAPSPLAIDVQNITPGTPDLTDYQVEMGPLPFGSTYQRSLGGTSLHWLGLCPRMVPNDFSLQRTYGHGVDWPISYDDLAPYYELAEWRIGVSANVADQTRFGIHFPPGYDYPMERIPPSWSDQQIESILKEKRVSVRFGDVDYPLEVSSVAAARNSIPREAVAGMGDWYRPVGARGAQNIGQRCEGNSSCIPICPVQAKYTALKTLGLLRKDRHTLLTQTVARKLLVAPNGDIEGIECAQYPSEGTPDAYCTTITVKATLYVLAAHAVENAKLLLASSDRGVGNSSDQVGRNLMDHPYFITWGMAPRTLNLGQWRGPGTISEIPNFRDGAFRKDFAAFRVDLGNWGWDVVTFPPGPTVAGMVNAGTFGPALRRELAEVMPNQFRIGYVIEQLPEARNRVTVSRTYMGAMGTYRPVISYDISDYTRAAMMSAWDVSKTVFAAMGIKDLTAYDKNRPGFLTYHTPEGKTVDLASMGSGHHMGTHRMGASRSDSVVDSHQKSWDHDNLYIVGCGSFPTSASSNPTLTAAALGLRSASKMLEQLNRLG